MSVTIIIPSYNGEQKLPNILKSLTLQSYKDFEVIVVIDGSTDDSVKVLKKQSFDLQSLIIHERENGGRSRARNSGVEIAKGDLIVFLDDDMRATPSLIKEHVDFHARNNAILVGVQQEELSILKTDFQKFKANLSKKWMNELGLSLTKLRHSFLTSANCSMTKKIFYNLEGFDEALTDAEDYDLAVKAKEKKVDIYFQPLAIAWHDDFITCQSYIKRLKEYNKAHIQLTELYPKRHERVISNIEKSVFKTLVFGLFSFRFWQNIIDDNYLSFLPQKVRYTIYDWVVTAQSVYFDESKI